MKFEEQAAAFGVEIGHFFVSDECVVAPLPTGLGEHPEL